MLLGVNELLTSFRRSHSMDTPHHLHEPEPSHDVTRPHWWAILAVSLALMALIAAISTQPRPPREATSGFKSRSVPVPAKPRLGLNDPSASTTTSASSHPIPGAASTQNRQTEDRTGTPSAASTPTRMPPPSTAPAMTSSSQAHGTSSSASPGVPDIRSYPGYFEFPEDVSANLVDNDVSGSISASVTWSGTGELELSLECPSESKSVSGSSDLSLTLVTTDLTCTAVLVDLSQAPGTISYLLTLSSPAS